MVRNDPASLSETRVECISIDSLTHQVLQRFASAIESKQIRVDEDLVELSADVYPRFIHSAVSQLIENAIEAVSAGGELNVTLIDGGNCWELEVADSGSEATATTTDSTPAYSRNPNQPGPANLPRLLPLSSRSNLEMARRAAMVHGGQVQTLNCPQGGTANVLVIPRRQETRKSA